jgi:hypothetical protein
MARRKKSKAVPFTPADVAGFAKSNPYIQRLVEDPSVRENVRQAVDASKSLYGRLTNGRTSAKALFDDKKVQSDLRKAVEAVREVSSALAEGPQKRARKGLTFGRTVLIAGLGGALALVGSEKLRSKVLDLLFGAEEEFEYTPPASTPSTSTTESTQTPAGAA